MFRVVWLPPTLAELATIWTQADSAVRRRITEAAHTIDHQLQAHPHDQGEARAADERVLFAHPLGLLFEIDEEASVVWVLHVWDTRRR
jgi:hypothetical protein